MSISYQMGRLTGWLQADDKRRVRLRARVFQNGAKLDLARPDETTFLEPKHRVDLYASATAEANDEAISSLSFDLADAIEQALGKWEQHVQGEVDGG